MKKLILSLALSHLLSLPARADYASQFEQLITTGIKVTVVLGVVAVAGSIYFTVDQIQDANSTGKEVKVTMSEQTLGELNANVKGGILSLTQELADSSADNSEAIIQKFGGSQIVRTYVTSYFQQING